MPRIRSDDGPRKLRAVWHGPKGLTFPFAWTYQQWIVYLACSHIVGGIILAALWVLWAPLFAIVAAALYGIPLGCLAGWWLMRGVTYDEPIGYRVRMFLHLATHAGPAHRTQPQTWEIQIPAVSSLSPGASRALGWTTTTEDHHHHDAVPRRAAPRS